MDKPSTPRLPLSARGVADPIPSSSPAFGTPVKPVRTGKSSSLHAKPTVLPVLLPPSILRPVAFRTFTRKHNLTLSSNALQVLATFVGQNCGSKWREEGLAERLLDEVAKIWRKNGGGVIVEEGNGTSLQSILQSIENNMVSGRVTPGKVTDREDRPKLQRNGTAATGTNTTSTPIEDEDDDAEHNDTRKWIKTISAFEQPRLTYNPTNKHFETSTTKPSLLPQPSHQTAFWRDRHNLVHQRLLRNESFQTSSFASNVTQSYKISPIVNLLGRSGSPHLLVGLLSLSPTGELSLTDLTGSIVLDLSHARPVPEDGAWFSPGMMVLVDGIYEEEEIVRGSVLGGNGGIGGAIGGKFLGISIAGPPCERREVTLGLSSIHSSRDIGTSGGFGWIDFLGVGSERAQGQRMRKLENRYLRHNTSGESENNRRNMVIMGEVNLDNMNTFDALRHVFKIYNALPFEELPLGFVMIGNFIEKVGFGQGSGGNSIEYKECFDTLASLLSEFPALLRHTTFIFVPGDSDPWASSFSTGAASPIPCKPIPELFTSRVKRAFTVANNEYDGSSTNSIPGEAIWTSNPARVSIFGPVHEIVVFRDDISGRLRRSSVTFSERASQPEGTDHSNLAGMSVDDTVMKDDAEDKNSESPSVLATRKLVKTVLDQGNLSPSPLTSRPVLWDYASSIQLYPLPTALVLADSESPAFAITYEGCHTMNPGRLLSDGKRGPATWLEYDVLKNRARVRQRGN
ncbi:putative DNA polymerase epsilon subunit B [Talaromyces proteolyticus]|uniref:DNA polymerase epsilon subunit B n=1 Tax=Talaromyces proteolyticus TaxID=1131652 RepID=A0AAD4L467_9EURO|nr:putative DNA polymerase epsilon subunit B [Talaromyces proteolyticus]KAH8704716.1 putative DNA polymerase epsilon subunit B [Talaromyces proteolyticus]